MDHHSSLEQHSGSQSFFFDHSTPPVRDELLRVHEYERERLGQELHDTTGQLIVALHLGFARLRLDDDSPQHAKIIDDIQETIRQIDQQIRSLAFLHHPAELGTRGVDGAIQALVTGFGSRTGIEMCFESRGNFASLSDAVASTLLRIAQEALVNIHRHAHAKRARIVLRESEGGVVIIISDNGVGIPVKAASETHGIGLQGMLHRVRSLKGELQIRNLRPGLMISARIPAEDQKKRRHQGLDESWALASSVASVRAMLG